MNLMIEQKLKNTWDRENEWPGMIGEDLEQFK